MHVLARLQRGDRLGTAAREPGEAGADAEGASAEPLRLLAGTGDDGVHARRVTAAREDSDDHVVVSRFDRALYRAVIESVKN